MMTWDLLSTILSTEAYEALHEDLTNRGHQTQFYTDHVSNG